MGRLMLLSTLSGLCTPVGAILVLLRPHISARLVAGILGLASGVMASVSVTELLPTGLHTGGVRAFSLGIAACLALMAGVSRLSWDSSHALTDPARLLATGRSIALAIAVHDIPEGIAIFAGNQVQTQLGLILVLAIALHNLPEGMSIAAPLSRAGTPRRRIVGLTLAISAVTPLGTLLPSFFGTPSVFVNAFLLALAGGVMLFVVLHDTFPEAWRQSRMATVIGILIGLLLMSTVSHLHGSQSTLLFAQP